MQRLIQILEARLFTRPWVSLGASAIAGFILALLLPSGKAPRTTIPGVKEGFLIALPTAKLLDAPGDLKLRGSSVVFIHRDPDGGAPCRLKHPPLLFSANERLTTLTGSLTDLEQTVLAIYPEDLQNVDITSPHDPSVAPCSAQTKVVYGQEL